MNATLRRSRVLVAVAGLALVLAACGSSGGSSSNTLSGAGSSFQKSYEEALIAGFQGSNSDVTVTYNPVGSGSGKASLQTKDVDFAGTDSLPKPEELSSYQGGDLLYFPLAGAPITVSYNLPDVKTLKLDGETLAKIFAVKIKKWNDPAIASLNPGVDLPSTAITVAHRADGSGTTSNFTKYLDDVDPTDWTLGSGDTVEWPSNTQAGTGNPGVAQIVQQNRGCGRVRRPRRRHCGEAANRGDQEQGRQVRRADRRGKRSGGRDRDARRRPLVRPDQHVWCRGLPDHVPDLDHRVHEPVE